MKFSILGFGHIGKIHRQAIEQTKNAELIAIIDSVLNQEDLDVPLYSSLDDFLRTDKETEVVCIATPNGLHASQAIQCLENGRHVFIEKPISLNPEDAQDILEAAEKNGKRVFSSMQLRFSPTVNFVKNLIDNDSLGKIYMVNVQCYWNRNEAYYKSREWHGKLNMDGGVLFTQFSHFVDILNYWFAETSCTTSEMFNFNHQGCTEFPDSGIITFHANEAIGSMIFTTSTYNKNFESSITIIAEKGTIKIGDQYLNTLKYFDFQGDIDTENASTEQRIFHPNAIEDLIDAIENNRPSVLDGENALRLVSFIKSAYDLSYIEQVE